MRCRVVASALVAFVLAACGGDGKITEPKAVPNLTPLAAVGTDPATGATIATSRDDYMPGEIVHVTGSAWAPNETVRLFMTEDPDTHPDVTREVQADSTGAFSFHFYDVQPNDLGVTFTLTATGQTSGSRATAVFTDGNYRVIHFPAGMPDFLGDVRKWTGNNACTGSPNETNIGLSVTGTSGTTSLAKGADNTNHSLRFSVPASVSGYTFTNWTIPAGVVLGSGGLTDPTSLCIRGVSASTTFVITANYTAPVGNTAPVVSAGADATINEGATFSQNGSFTDPDANSWTATVDYGDGSGVQPLTLVGKTFALSHLYADNGTYNATVTVNDGTTSGSDVVVVTVNNVAPVVGAGADFNGAVFSQAGSFTDPGADTWTATVNYGDGSGVQALTLSGKNFTLSHTYAGSGNYTAIVTVTDDDGGTDTDDVVVNVANTAPVVSAGNDQTINEGGTFSQNGSFTDPDANSWTATVDYGDGSGVQPLTLVGKTFALSHLYADNTGGPFTVTVSVSDGTASGSDQVTVTVNNVAPTVNAFSGATINEGGTYSASGTFADPGADTWTATVNYGDGTGTQALTLGAGKTFNLSHVYADNTGGPFTVTVTVSDDDAGSGSNTASVTVNNVAPTVNAFSGATINEGGTYSASGTFADPGADTWTATVNYGDGTGTQALTLGAGKTFNLSHVYADNTGGPFTVTVTVSDDDGGSGSNTASVTVNNVAPTVNAFSGATINEGGTYSASGTFADPGADTWTATVNYGDGTGTQALTLGAGKTFNLNHTYADNTGGPFIVTVTVSDDDAGSGSNTASVTVNNVAPDITVPLTLPVSPVPAGTNVSMSWSFTDPGADTWTCEIKWDTDLAYSFVSASITPATKTCNASKVLSAGVYTVTVKVTDDDGGTDSEIATAYIVVYDPNGGFVTGGGWITSPVGAYPTDPLLSGKATFGFVSKYLKGATTPTGNTEFQFHVASMNFKSTSYEWLVVSGARGQYKGSGTINGSGDYGFLLTAIDGQLAGGGETDRFRIKIWNRATNTVVYDNQIGSLDDSPAATALGGGSIVIHTK